jgi:hypothetical protein
VFVTYGALDAFGQIVAAVAEVHTQREIKFPLLASILAEDVRQPERWTLLAGWIETLYLAPWYIDVRRLRNRRIPVFPVMPPTETEANSPFVSRGSIVLPYNKPVT